MLVVWHRVGQKRIIKAMEIPLPSSAHGVGFTDRFLNEGEARDVAAQLLCPLPLDGKKVLLIVPDGTRTAPVGLMFRIIHELIGEQVRQLDVMIALGTHQPMSEEAINGRLEISAVERATRYADVSIY